jgi:glutaminase
MKLQSVIHEIYDEIKKMPKTGKPADYIPELAKVNPDTFGMHLSTSTGKEYGIGDSEERFSLQSIAKVFALTSAYRILGEHLWDRVGVEPSGNPFNSLVQLEYEKGKPRNPFINSGALVICDILFDIFKDPQEEIKDLLKQLAGNESFRFNRTVALSEKETGFRNASLIHLMKSFGNIKHDVNEVLDFYYWLCSLEMNCVELSKAFLIFANGGIVNDKEILTLSKTKRMNALMQTCGFYDEAGEFSFKVGLPGKSGVGGGIAAIHPGEYSVAVWSPRLNEKGNSVLGMKALELLTTKTELSIF